MYGVEAMSAVLGLGRVVEDDLYSSCVKNGVSLSLCARMCSMFACTHLCMYRQAAVLVPQPDTGSGLCF